MKKTILMLSLALLPALAQAADRGAPQTVDDETTAGRTLLKAVQPDYPKEEQGRWTASCVALYFTVRADGKTDNFVVLEVPRKNAGGATQTEAEKLRESRGLRRFVQPAIDAVFRWEYAPAAAPTEEIAVLRYERGSVGGRLMKYSARRLDLGTKNARACEATLDPAQVREIVARGRRPQ